MEDTIKYWDQYFVNRKSVEQELIPFHFPPVSSSSWSSFNAWSYQLVISLATQAWEVSSLARQQEEDSAFSQQWTLHMILSLLSPCVPPSPHSNTVGSNPVQSNAWIAHVRLSFGPSFRNIAQTHCSRRESSVRSKGNQTSCGKNKRNQIISGLHLQ